MQRRLFFGRSATLGRGVLSTRSRSHRMNQSPHQQQHEWADNRLSSRGEPNINENKQGQFKEQPTISTVFTQLPAPAYSNDHRTKIPRIVGTVLCPLLNTAPPRAKHLKTGEGVDKWPNKARCCSTPYSISQHFIIGWITIEGSFHANAIVLRAACSR